MVQTMLFDLEHEWCYDVHYYPSLQVYKSGTLLGHLYGVVEVIPFSRLVLVLQSREFGCCLIKLL